MSKIDLDFAILTILQEEYLAVVRALTISGQIVQYCDQPFDHHFAELNIELRSQQVETVRGIVTCAEGVGRVESVIASQEILSFFHPRFFFLIGLAGGFNRNNVDVGDILIATSIIDYERQRIEDNDIQIRWHTYDINSIFTSDMEITKKDWLHIMQEENQQRKTPNIHLGPILSGEKVVASSKMVDRFLEDWPSAIGIEMEGAGIAMLLEKKYSLDGFCMIRGVSDLANSKKRTESFEWSNFACDASASYAISLLLSLMRKDKSAS